VLEELRRIGFADIGAYFDEQGKLRQIRDLPPEARAALASVKVVIKNVAAGDGHVDFVHEIKQWDKPRALEMLAKHFKLLTDQLEVTDKTDPEALEARVGAGRRRASARNKKA
jgi:phage terminase small subunit